MSILIKFLRIYIKSGLRGNHRLTNFLSNRFESLQNVPIQTENGILIADLRLNSAHGIVRNPKSQSGEDTVMKTFVKSNDVVFDIGAHLGFYTLLLSNLVGENGKVVAFEPNPELLPSLKKTTARLSNIELFDFALSNQEGDMNFYIPEDASMASLKDWTEGIAGNVHTITCKIHKLDNLYDSKIVSFPQFIKCDVEGAELSIFEGASKLLNRVDAPIILFELNALAAESFNHKTTDYTDFLLSMNQARYNLFEVSSEGIKKLQLKDIKYTNVLAIPESKLKNYQL